MASPAANTDHDSRVSQRHPMSAFFVHWSLFVQATTTSQIKVFLRVTSHGRLDSCVGPRGKKHLLGRYERTVYGTRLSRSTQLTVLEKSTSGDVRFLGLLTLREELLP